MKGNCTTKMYLSKRNSLFLQPLRSHPQDRKRRTNGKHTQEPQRKPRTKRENTNDDGKENQHSY